MMRVSATALAQGVDSPSRLEGWKSIATFVGRDERTAKRWETTRGLPVRRLPGDNRSMVFAYVHELIAWRDSTHVVDPAGDAATAAEAPVGEGAGSPSPILAPGPVPPADARVAVRRPWRWHPTGVLLAVAILILGGWLVVHRPAAAPGVVGGTRDRLAAAAWRQGRLEWSLRTRGSLEAALASFHAAIARDPGYAQAHAGLAQTYELLRQYGGMPEGEAYPKAEAAARRALAIAPDLAEAHAALAFALFWWDWDRGAAEREFRAAIRLDPDAPTPHHWLATALQAERRLPEALAEVRRARELDPSCASCAADEAGILYTAGRVRQATAILRRLEAVDPSLATPHRNLAQFAWVAGDVPTYLGETDAVATLRGDPYLHAEVARQRAAWTTHGRAALLAELAGASRRAFADGRSGAFQTAEGLAMAGDRDGALEFLTIALHGHDPSLISAAIDPALRPLAREPRFAALLAEIRKAP